MAEGDRFYHAVTAGHGGYLCGTKFGSGSMDVNRVTCPDCREIIYEGPTVKRLRETLARLDELEAKLLRQLGREEEIDHGHSPR